VHSLPPEDRVIAEELPYHWIALLTTKKMTTGVISNTCDDAEKNNACHRRKRPGRWQALATMKNVPASLCWQPRLDVGG
jgi:hypothetical protein